tara:strand:- start:765 stop:2528 length:1764 start_codon:yes stop_codon:yes gene_type:complete
MPGGLMNLVYTGQENIILTGNPKKTFFSTTYKKYTNFGLQRFRIDFTGDRVLSFEKETAFEFKIPRYAELLLDTYLAINLPDIWSPLFSLSNNGLVRENENIGTDYQNDIIPYQFRWVKHFGAKLIRKITIHSGGAIISEYSGEWLYTQIERDEQSKKDLWERMIGHEERFYDPAAKHNGYYPNATYKENGCEPSIKGRRLYIPIGAWFNKNSRLALPLIALQYQEVFIKIELSPVKELFTIMDIPESIDNRDLALIQDVYTEVPNEKRNKAWPKWINSKSYRRAPKPSSPNEQLWIFLQEPPNYPGGTNPGPISNDRYIRRNDWNTDIHLIGCYVFLSNEERRVMAGTEQKYLIKNVYEHEFKDIFGATSVNILARNMVSTLTFRFRRTDVYIRNEWFNYSNWEWDDFKPYGIDYQLNNNYKQNKLLSAPSYNEIYGLSKDFKIENNKEILINLGIRFGEEYRENVYEYGIYNYIEKWNRTSGIAKDGIYIYNFSLDSNANLYQPCGAQSMNKWKHLTFEFTSLLPPIVEGKNTDVDILCDEDRQIVSVRKNPFQLNKYNYDLKVYEERYNVLIVTAGRMGLQNAR